MITTITHAYEVFRTLNIVLKDTPIVEILRFEFILLAELVDTRNE